jgi:hypothetical protein
LMDHEEWLWIIVNIIAQWRQLWLWHGCGIFIGVISIDPGIWKRFHLNSKANCLRVTWQLPVFLH